MNYVKKIKKLYFFVVSALAYSTMISIYCLIFLQAYSSSQHLLATPKYYQITFVNMALLNIFYNLIATE